MKKKVVQNFNVKKETWIYWRWINDKTFSKSFVQDIIITYDGQLLHLSDGFYTNYPKMILRKEIYIAKIK